MTSLTSLGLLLGIGIIAAAAFCVSTWRERRIYRAWQREQDEVFTRLTGSDPPR